MKKFIKILAMLIVATLLTACTVAFAACGDSEGLDADTIYITVLDENGNAIDGTTFGRYEYSDNEDDIYQVQIQFCSVNLNEGGCAEYTADVDANGKAEFPRSAVRDLNENDILVELHVLYVTARGYVKEYNQYKISEIPQEITITLAIDEEG